MPDVLPGDFSQSRNLALSQFLVASRAIMLAVAFCAMTGWSQAQDRLPPGTKTGFVTTADRVRIHYFEAGRNAMRQEQQKRTILLVPGWMTPGWIWENQVAHFSKNHRVVAMDQRSQGQSSKPNDGHDPASRARDIKRVVDQLKLAPVVLVACTSIWMAQSSTRAIEET